MKKILLLISILFIIFSCAFQTNTDAKFEEVKELAKHRDAELFDVFKQDLSEEERDYLKFLYTSMPLTDLADYDGEFFLKQVQASIQAKNEIPWAKHIPEYIFQRFVLPYRVNNENLDTARIIFYQELKERVAGLSMYEAALEVNHWCHEKVSYRPADGRTSAPLATMKTAYGRCGEESTFAVAALRSVCIPARQVYTPRWAHSDDNHAWVEVWIDGEWHFIGACEPEPVLDLGWFNESASRAMLIHARVFGKSDGREEINVQTSQYDDINVITRYAHTFRQYVKVTDTDGKPVPDATVEYQLYNYAEFYPITKKMTDKNGMSFLTTGLGELVIWARNDDSFGFQKVKIGENDTVNIVMSNPEFHDAFWELTPPPASDKLKVNLTDNQIENNKNLLQQEDSIRNGYVSTFISESEFTQKYDKKYWKYVKASRGNYAEIIDFIDSNLDNEWTLELLDVIAQKDLRDIKSSILKDHLRNSMNFAGKYSDEIFKNYILNPRVELEMVKPYRQFFQESMDTFSENGKQFTPENLINWIKDNVQIDNDRQAYSLPITPIGVFDLRVSDDRSRNIFFVAVCRSLGMPARLEPGTNTPQYLSGENWIDAIFSDMGEQPEKYNVRFKVRDKDLKFTPQYYHHFTLAKFENNRFNTIELDEYQDIDKIDDLMLTTGIYQLITSNRLSSGKILVDLKYFEIANDTTIGLTFPKQQIKIENLGSIDRKKLSDYLPYQDMRAKGQQENTNLVIAMIQPDKEPSKHVLNDIQKIQRDFEALNNTLVFLIDKKDMPATFTPDDYPNLPYRTFFVEIDKTIGELFDLQLKQKSDAFPQILIATSEGIIIYHSSGYKIGIGNDILERL